MNDDETDDVLRFEPVLDAEDLVELEVEPYDDDYVPAEEVILLDTLRLEDDDLFELV